MNGDETLDLLLETQAAALTAGPRDFLEETGLDPDALEAFAAAGAPHWAARKKRRTAAAQAYIQIGYEIARRTR